MWVGIISGSFARRLPPPLRSSARRNDTTPLPQAESRASGAFGVEWLPPAFHRRFRGKAIGQARLTIETIFLPHQILMYSYGFEGGNVLQSP